MKPVLSLLVAYSLLQSQSWALSGGPVYAGSQQSLVGTYAGALLPSDGGEDEGETATPGEEGAAVDETTVNGLGLFTLSVPSSGLGTGTFVYFSEGRTFTGTITGLADPDKGELIGLLKGQFDIVVDNIQIDDDFFGDASLVQTRPGGFANGQIRASFEGGGVNFSSTGTTGGGGLRLDGTAQVEISEPQVVTTPIAGAGSDGIDNDEDGDIDEAGESAGSTQQTTVVRTSTLNLVVDGFQQSTVAATNTNGQGF
ncbi:MAG TPA: hypothetical protein VF614_00175 [Chthoniobacteraceae bacterium]|jgi:hypothetical protein